MECIIDKDTKSVEVVDRELRGAVEEDGSWSAAAELPHSQIPFSWNFA
jgi:hypothetical protein